MDKLFLAGYYASLIQLFRHLITPGKIYVEISHFFTLCSENLLDLSCISSVPAEQVPKKV
jgi:hypothetical protein